MAASKPAPFSSPIGERVPLQLLSVGATIVISPLMFHPPLTPPHFNIAAVGLPNVCKKGNLAHHRIPLDI